MIPVSHARIAHAAIPGSRLEILKDSGHMPFHDHPERFVEIVERFVDSTHPADYDQELLRWLLRTGIDQDIDSGSVDAASSRRLTHWASFSGTAGPAALRLGVPITNPHRLASP